jgi:hypothetical protein
MIALATLILATRIAGVCQLATVALAHFTPIPRDWDEGLKRLSDVHRRFATAQNIFIGAVMVFSGVVSLAFAPDLVAGTSLARAVCFGIALWWGGRLCVLPWLRVGPELRTATLRLGCAALCTECACMGFGYGWLTIR